MVLENLYCSSPWVGGNFSPGFMTQTNSQTLAEIVTHRCSTRYPTSYGIARARVDVSGVKWETMWEEFGGRVNKSAQAVWGRSLFYEEMYRAGVSARQIGFLCNRPHSTVLWALREAKKDHRVM